MFYTVYKVTNLINDKIYIGVHKTLDLDDGYMGSGAVLKRAQDKYGIENFSKEIIEVYDNPEDMFNMESELVNETFVSDKETYNIKLGGLGGWDHLNGEDKIVWDNKLLQPRAVKRLEWLRKNDKKWQTMFANTVSVASKKFFENGGVGSFKGKTHTEETKKKIGEKNSIHQKGEGNSQFGKIWIYNPELKESKKIPKGDLIPDGWSKGRKIKF